MTVPTYPSGTVLALLDTAHLTPATAHVLKHRLAQPYASLPRFFDAHAFATLHAVCNRLLPQPDRADPIRIAAALDAGLADDAGRGWRYAAMPPDGTAYRWGLQGVDECAKALFNAPFQALLDQQQDAVLSAIQQGDVAGGVWARLPAQAFFELLLVGAMNAYFVDLRAMEEIGCVAMADVPGWVRVGLDQLDAREPRLIRIEAATATATATAPWPAPASAIDA